MRGFSRRKFALPGNFCLLHRQDHLDEPGHAGHGLEMPDVRFRRAEADARAGARHVAKRALQRIDLDRIAERRTGAVRLYDSRSMSPRHPARRNAAEITFDCAKTLGDVSVRTRPP